MIYCLNRGSLLSQHYFQPANTRPSLFRESAQTSPSKSVQEEYPKRHNLPIPAWISMVAGSLSGAVTALFTAPLDIARTRQQVTKSNKPLFIVLEEMVAHDGLRGLWMGTGPTLLGLIPTWAVYWLAYHSLKNYQTQSLGLDGDSAWLHLRCTFFVQPAL